jgi:uncharacterized membrane protein YeaQ/YmgE (transglycosylase-associated protein family)
MGSRLPACVFRVHTADSRIGWWRVGRYDMWAIIAWIILGLIAGFIASKIVNKAGSGMLADIVLGVIGAIVGGYIGNLIGMGPTVRVLSFWNIILAVIGACIVLWVYHKVIERA